VIDLVENVAAFHHPPYPLRQSLPNKALINALIHGKPLARTQKPCPSNYPSLPVFLSCVNGKTDEFIFFVFYALFQTPNFSICT
jgi:hypothetical protein